MPRILSALAFLAFACLFSHAAFASCAGAIPKLRVDAETFLRAPAAQACNYHLALTSGGGAENVTIPTDVATGLKAKKVIFSPDSNCGDFSVKMDGTATTDTTDITNGAASYRNPVGFDLSQGSFTTVGAISPGTTCNITVEFYM